MNRPIDVDALACYVVLDDGRLLSFTEDHPMRSGEMECRTTVLVDPRLLLPQVAADLRRIADALDFRPGFYVDDLGAPTVCEVPAPADCISK